MVIFHYEDIRFVFQWEIPLFIAEIVSISGFGTVNIGKITEIESFIYQFVSADLCFASGVQFLQDTPVFPQGIIDTADITVGIPV
jgi:hypothetical protein